MSGYEDTESERRHKAPYTKGNPIPTIKRYKEEKEERQEEARKYDNQADDEQNDEREQQDAGAQDTDHANSGKAEDEAQPAIDTSQVDAAATDPRERRKDLKKRKDERAEREVTDPVTHLPVKIHDLTSDALKEVPENDEPFGSTTETATGLTNKKKSGKQLQAERQDLQSSHDSMRVLFPPPNFETVKRELTSINNRGLTVGLVGTAAILALAAGLEKLFVFERFANAWLTGTIIWLIGTAISVGAISALIFGIRDWTTKRVDSLWDHEVWDANAQNYQVKPDAHETETVAWLNALLGSVWPLVNPDLFTSLADTLEDVMQASLPKMVEMVSVNDIGQGAESIRILGVKWLPTGAAARPVTEDGDLKDSTSANGNDRKVQGEGEVDQPQENSR